MAQDPSLQGKPPSPLTKERFRELSKPPGSSKLMDNHLLDAVFSGGYYIVFNGEEYYTSSTDRNTRVQQKRNQKNEEALRLANLTQQLMQDLRQPAQSAADTNAAVQENSQPSRHDRLLAEIQTLIGKSDLVSNPHEQHLKDEISIARMELLRGGAIDDYALMQTLQEIAELQGLSLGGSSIAGKFAADIVDPPEPAPEAAMPAEHPQASPVIDVAQTVFSQSVFERDREEYLQREFEQFSAYDISEVGALQKSAFFFAQKIMDGLVEVDTRSQPEQNQVEIVP